MAPISAAAPNRPMSDTNPAVRCRDSFESALLVRLTRAGRLDSAAAQRALRVRSDSGQRLEAVLAKLGLVSERDIVDAVAAELGIPAVDAAGFPHRPVLADVISAKFLRESCILPLGATPTELVLAMADPLNDYAVRAVEMSTGLAVSVRVAAPADIEAAYERLHGSAKSPLGEIGDGIEPMVDDGALDDIDRLRDLASEAPVIRLVNTLIARAIEARASDIHIEPFGSKLLVRYRIDGMLRESPAPPLRLRAAVVSRLKIMARLNIAERRLPQDGRIRFTFRGRDFDLRVSTMPTLHGEAVVMRILDRASLVSEFAALGFDAPTEKAFLEALRRPQGIVLVTGPTGSGKTTTLYTGLLQLNDSSKKLFTIEDPIEYELAGVNQVQVKTQIGLGFAQILRGTLRHDPDVVMIGEIRDVETAEVAAQAALTGHTVLSTLHTNDAPSSVTRLLDMGVEGYLITSTLTAVLAQRLVRKLCPHCRKPCDGIPEIAADLVVHGDGDGGAPSFCRPVGCEACHGSGYRGRMAITEILMMSDSICRLVLKSADAGAIRRTAAEAGMTTMYMDGLRKARQGLTTVEEVLRVTRNA
jgi:general secretion pathway protein E